MVEVSFTTELLSVDRRKYVLSRPGFFEGHLCQAVGGHLQPVECGEISLFGFGGRDVDDRLEKVPVVATSRAARALRTRLPPTISTVRDDG